MVKYELVVVLEVNRPEEEINKSLDKIQDVITKNGGAVENRESWGKRRLAYPINRRRDGHYTLIMFEADPQGQALAELNRYLRITEDVLRHLITKAVIGKSTGNAPPEGPDAFRQRGGYGGGRGGGYGGRGGYDRDRGPRTDRSERTERPSETPASTEAKSTDNKPEAKPSEEPSTAQG